MMTKVKVLICVMIVSYSAVYAQETTESSMDSISKYTLADCLNVFKFRDTIKTKVGYQYWFLDKNELEGRTLKMSVVAPHKSTHDPHRHIEDEIFFVLEGTAEFYLNGETVESGPYASFYCPSNSLHGIRNVGDTDLKYLVIKTYNLD